jgi:hypothetical protein
MEMSAYRVEPALRHELSSVPIPAPTETFKPLPHGDFVDIIEDVSNDLGFAFGEQNHGLSHNGARYFGAVELLGLGSHSDYVLQLGIRNSLDKKYSASLVLGATVTVCCNGMFFGDFDPMFRKHTNSREGGITRYIRELVMNYLLNAEQTAQVQEWRTDCYQNQFMSDRDAHDLLCRLAVTRDLSAVDPDEAETLPVCVNTSRVEKVLKEWHDPSYDHGDKSVWRFHNAVTESFKGVNVNELPSRTNRLNQACDVFAGFAPAQAA